VLCWRGRGFTLSSIRHLIVSKDVTNTRQFSKYGQLGGLVPIICPLNNLRLDVSCCSKEFSRLRLAFEILLSWISIFHLLLLHVHTSHLTLPLHYTSYLTGQVSLESLAWVVEPKIDGLAVSATYKDGLLIKVGSEKANLSVRSKHLGMSCGVPSPFMELIMAAGCANRCQPRPQSLV